MTARARDHRQVDVAVVGGGAAGLLAATFAARAGASVLLLESAARPGAKIRVSGGGRCNVLPSRMNVEDFHTHGSVPAMRNVLAGWPLEDVRDHFERHLRVPLKVESTGKVFPASDSSRDVVEALLTDLDRSGAGLEAGARVLGIRPRESTFSLSIHGRGDLRASRVVLATGGRSLPKTGSDGAGYAFAADLGHSIVPTYPALVPLTTGDAGWTSLAGLAVPATLDVRVRDKRVARHHGDFLFTHQGFSGPVALDVSRWFTDPKMSADARLFAGWGEPGTDPATALDAGGARTVAAAIRDVLPRRLADAILARAEVEPATRLAELPRDARRRLRTLLTECPLPVSGSLGYAKAEVTAGGVPLSELHLGTLESRLAPGLFLAGEILDVTGRIGGFNFLWAWVTGRRAGEGAVASLGTVG